MAFSLGNKGKSTASDGGRDGTPARARDAYVTGATLDARLAAWLKQLEGSSGRASLPSLAVAALLLVDCQRLFLEPSSPAFLPAWTAVSGRCEMLLTLFRAARLPVIWTRHIDAGAVSAVIGHFGGRPLHRDDPHTFFARGWTPRADEVVLSKSRYSAWAMTRLRSILAPESVLVIAGVTTHRCVLATAVDAAAHDRIAIIAADACATSGERLHLDALSVASNGFAHVASVREIAEGIGVGG